MKYVQLKPDFTKIAASEIHSFNNYDIFRRKDGSVIISGEQVC